MKRATTITATYRIVTPMFCSGTNRLQPELRAASFKGLMRFWWRASRWSRFAGNADSMDDLNSEEQRLFGSAKTGRGKFTISLRWKNEETQSSDYVRDWPRNRGPAGSTYLGYGITESGKKEKGDFKPHREGWPEGQDFDCVLRINQTAESHDESELRAILEIMGLFGGMGSRSRRGFGSIQLVAIDEVDAGYESIEAIRNLIPRLCMINPNSSELPPLTAFSRFSRLAFLAKSGDPFSAMDTLGTEYRNFRGQPGELRGRTKIPLGLPLKGVDESNRRGSPLFMHVLRLQAQYVPAVLFLPSVFHPDVPHGDQISFFDVADQWMTQLNGEAL